MTKKVSILTLFLLFLASASLFAYWSDSSYISYNNGANYSQDMGISPIPKTTDERIAGFQQTGKTTWSTPTARLVNSEKADRSLPVALPDGNIYIGHEANGTINYYYYYRIDGAWNQITTGHMYFRYNPY